MSTLTVINVLNDATNFVHYREESLNSQSFDDLSSLGRDASDTY